MSKIVIFLAVYMLSTNVIACIADPLHSVAQNPKPFNEHSDIVFLGKIIAFDDLTRKKQIVTFAVEKTFKGPELNNVTISNSLTSSCSRAFIELGSSYYVFAKLSKSDGNFVIESYATFVPLKVAEEHELTLEKTHSKSFNSN